MMSQTVIQLSSQLKTIKVQRKERDIDLRTYYTKLLEMVSELSAALVDEIQHLDEEDVILQIPLVLLFVEEQIRKFDNRS